LKLPEDVRELLVSGQLTPGHARTLMTASDPSALARRIVSEGLSVRQAEALQQERAEGSGTRAPRVSRETTQKDADTLALEKRLGDALGLDVNIAHGDKGGKLEIRYRTLEQLDAVCQRLSDK
jgi:ParB family chromosome partitioning protein